MTRTIVLGVLLLLVSAAPWGGGPRFLSPPMAFALDEAERLWVVGSHAYDDGLYALSGRMLERLIDRYPRDSHVGDATLILGKVRLSQKQYQPALDAFRRAATMSPAPGRPGEARFWEAEALFRMKKYSDARD